MAVWTDISDAVLEPGKPIRSVDGIALRENPKAIAEGAAGAPKIQEAALDASVVTTNKIANLNVTAPKLNTGAAETTWVGNMFSNLSLGARGMLAFAKAVSGGAVGPGGTRSGSVLRYTSLSSDEPTDIVPSGTWMCLGSNGSNGTLWVRVA